MKGFAKASEFMAANARLLDRRRFGLLTGKGRAEDLLSALDGYRNPDGGYGMGLEPDLRSVGSQPAGALHAFEVLHETGSVTSPHAGELCDWLASVTLADGGLPFALPIADPVAVAPWWLEGDPTQSSLQITCAVVEMAHRVARQDRTVRDHPWLTKATEYCWTQTQQMDSPNNTLEFRYALWFLNAVHDVLPRASAELIRLGRHIPESGSMAVAGGLAGESIRPLDFSPRPGEPIRALFPPALMASELVRLAKLQQDDGGWPVDWASWSTAGALEWRGWATVRAISILRSNDALR